jgi:hypothetical protein
MNYPVGTHLKVTPGTTSGGVGPLTTTYQWELDGVPIGGATSIDFVTTDPGALTCVQTVVDANLVEIFRETASVTIEALPVVSDVTATAGDGLANLTATSSKNGTMYWYVSEIGVAPSAEDLILGTGATYAFDEPCVATVPATQEASPLVNLTSYFLFAMVQDASGNNSDIVNTLPFVPEEDVAPILSETAASTINSTSANLVCLTTDTTGTFYWFVSTSATPPIAARMIDGVGAAFHLVEATDGSTMETVATGLTPSTEYWAHAYQVDGAAQASNIDTSVLSFTTASAGAGASIEVDFVGDTLPHEIVSTPVGSAAQPIELDYPADFPYLLEGLPFNTLVNVLVTAIDGVDESTALDEDIWTSPETAPTLTLGTPTENAVPFTISGTAPASTVAGSGYVLEKNVDGAGWVAATPAFVAYNGDLTQDFSGLAGNTDHQFRVRAINEQPNTINDPAYSPYATTATVTTAADTTAPTIPTSVSVTAVGETTATLNATFAETGGTGYWFISESATEPADITDALDVDCVALYTTTPTGAAETQAASGLTTGIEYFLHVAQDDGASPTPNLSPIETTVGFTPAVAGSTLLDNLVAWWALEGTGNRIDSSGNGYTLTDNNTVASGTGKVANGANFVAASNEYFNSTDAALRITGSWTMAMWLKFDDLDTVGYQGIAAVIGNKWRIYNRDQDRIRMEHAGGVYDFYFTRSNGVFYHVVFGKNTATNKVFCTVNNATLVEFTDSNSWSGGTDFQLGYTDLGGGSRFDGVMDEVGYWSRVLTADERAELYNSSNGITYTDL